MSTNLEQNRQLPLVVDLDGTVIKTDMLYEGLVNIMVKKPSTLLQVAKTMLEGRASFKSHVSKIANVDLQFIPLNKPFVEFLRIERSKGRKLILATAADRSVAKGFAEHLGLFDEVIASDGKTNLKGEAKARSVSQKYPDGFVYAGDSRADLAVWRMAHGAVLVNTRNRTEAKVRSRLPVERSFPNTQSAFLAFFRAMRLHQWIKNGLLFVPILSGLSLVRLEGVVACLIGFIIMSLGASATYMINDMVDLEADRQHETKRHRPFASGDLNLAVGGIGAIVMLIMALGGSVLLSPAFSLVFVTYLLLTLSYSFWLKKMVLVDTFVIGLLFTIRVQMGVILAGLPFSGWLLSFSAFFFLSLALAKRHVELVKCKKAGKVHVPGRSYVTEDSQLTLTVGVTSSLIAIVILMLYLSESAFLEGSYRNPDMLWFAPLLILLWVLRVWMLSHRGLLNDDPIIFALKDLPSLTIGFATLACILYAAIGPSVLV